MTSPLMKNAHEMVTLEEITTNNCLVAHWSSKVKLVFYHEFWKTTKLPSLMRRFLYRGLLS